MSSAVQFASERMFASMVNACFILALPLVSR
jgi:hypothetical protein